MSAGYRGFFRRERFSHELTELKRLQGKTSVSDCSANPIEDVTHPSASAPLGLGDGSLDDFMMKFIQEFELSLIAIMKWRERRDKDRQKMMGKIKL